MIYRLEVAPLTATDLVAEMARCHRRGDHTETYSVWLAKHPERAQLLWVPTGGRAGIAWGGDADWTSADSPEEAIRRWLDGNMTD